MERYIYETIEILAFIFLLPYLIIYGLFRMIKKMFGYKLEKVKEEWDWKMYVGALFIWLVIGSFVLYENQFKYINYVYACPNENSSKCYQMRADISNDDGYKFVEKIYFDDGGTIDFSYCEIDVNNGVCYEEDGNKPWRVEISDRREKIKK